MKLELDLDAAFRNLFSPEGPWYHARPRLVPYAFPAVRPRFTIAQTEKVFCIGSCFARSLELYLASSRYRVPSLDFSEPEAPGQPEGNQLLNKVAPAGIYQEAEWAARVLKEGGRVELKHCREFMLDGPEGKVIDMRVSRFSPLPEDTFLERRRQIYSAYVELFTSDCVILAPAQTQAWFDKDAGAFIDIAPQIGSLFDRERFSFKVLDYGESLYYLDKTIALLRELNPRCKFLLVVAPEPLFCGLHRRGRHYRQRSREVCAARRLRRTDAASRRYGLSAVLRNKRNDQNMGRLGA